jgi:hypothetical protein
MPYQAYEPYTEATFDRFRSKTNYFVNFVLTVAATLRKDRNGGLGLKQPPLGRCKFEEWSFCAGLFARSLPDVEPFAA